MKHTIFLFLMLNSSIVAFSQTVVQHPYVLIGVDSLPSGELEEQFFFVFNELNGGASFGRKNDIIWHGDSIGVASFSAGYNTFSSGISSVSLGSSADARGDIGSVSLGSDTEAGGKYGSTAIGVNSRSIGDYGAVAIGDYNLASGNRGAIALGSESEASGDDGAVAIGYFCNASGDDGAIAMGFESMATGEHGAVAIGDKSMAIGDHGAVALGYESEARGEDGAIAMGYSAIAIGNTGATAGGASSRAIGNVGATAFGAYTKAIGNEGATAMGHESEAIGNTGTMALGNYTLANGNFGAVALGNHTIANGNSCTVVGMYNEALVDSAKTVKPASPIFVVGNGFSVFDRSNALIVKKDGKMGVGRNPLVNLLEVEGEASKTIAGNWKANSDRRIKTDILDIKDSYNQVLELRPVKFKYTDEWRALHPEIKDQYYYNFIAQEFAEVFPNAVQGSGDFLEGDAKEILQVDTYNAQIVHLAATQELIKDIGLLKEENKQLKNRLADIENHLLKLASLSSENQLDSN